MEIRRATENDLDFLAWVQLAASRSHLEVGIWEYLNDHSEEEALAFLRRLAGTDAVHWCHWSRFVIAEVDGTPAAAMCGFDPVPHGMHALLSVYESVLQAGGQSAAEMPGFMDRAIVTNTLDLGYADGSWVVENVGTRPEFRRQGLVEALLNHLLDEGRSLGFTTGQISVLLGNEPARKAYLKVGFEYDSERRSAEFEAALGSAGAERLLQAL